jgi:hypothetical protein
MEHDDRLESVLDSLGEIGEFLIRSADLFPIDGIERCGGDVHAD